MNTNPISFAEQAADNLHQLRKTMPLIHNLASSVSANLTAGVLLAAGASPVMAHAATEVEEMVSKSQALVLNIGTLDDVKVSSMFRAGRRASEHGVPIVLDPAGAGATRLRTDAAHNLLTGLHIRVVRCNPSVMLALGGKTASTRGVDSIHTVDEAKNAAEQLARETGVVAVVTGKEDFVTDGTRSLWVHNGHALLDRVAGSGSGSTAVIAAFVSIYPDVLVAAATALAYYGFAAEIAAEKAPGPGSLVPHLLDALYLMQPDELKAGCRIDTVETPSP